MVKGTNQDGTHHTHNLIVLKNIKILYQTKSLVCIIDILPIELG